MHPLVRLAKSTVEAYVKGLKRPDVTSFNEEPFTSTAGVFVSLKKHGALRGCIGTFSPVTDNVAQETVRNAIAASSQDPRFPAVIEDELNELDYSVDVLSAPETIVSRDELDPKRYGVIVSLGGRRGLLLPDLEGVDSVEEQLGITMSKAGIPLYEADNIKIEKFEVKRYR
ncbi:AmmeMemoRadiSam system protein A [Nitrospirota bacterium]